ncbi:regulatory protein RecX [Candidatus Sororendozoicomonas aggregata]|uniref:regulatory protein RecX n=1 Tax=Candidatus Sororendozoicomonas aggregata TaxID=3073239 RepID=UPI002ED69DCB
MLTRREHSRTELYQKLARIINAPDVIDGVLNRLEKAGLVSDERFTESFIRLHLGRGHGPARIRQGLKQKGIDEAVILRALEEANPDWFELAQSARIKKFGEASPNDPKEKARQIRFLQYRGFSLQVIMALF